MRPLTYCEPQQKGGYEDLSLSVHFGIVGQDFPRGGRLSWEEGPRLREELIWLLLEKLIVQYRNTSWKCVGIIEIASVLEWMIGCANVVLWTRDVY
jgi:hypothetical protein